MKDLPLKGSVARNLARGGVFKPCDCKHQTAWSYDTQGSAKVCDKSVSCKHSVGLYVRHLVEAGKSLEEVSKILLDPKHIGARWLQNIDNATEVLAKWFSHTALQIAGLVHDPTFQKPKHTKKWHFRPSPTGWVKVLQFIEGSDIVGLDALHTACAKALGWRKSLVWDYIQQGRALGYIEVSKVDTQPGRRGRKPMVAKVVAYPKIERKVLRECVVDTATGEISLPVLGHLTKKQMLASLALNGDIDFPTYLARYGADLEHQKLVDKVQRKKAEKRRFFALREGKEKAPSGEGKSSSHQTLGATHSALEGGWRSETNSTHLSPVLQAVLKNFSGQLVTA